MAIAYSLYLAGASNDALALLVLHNGQQAGRIPLKYGLEDISGEGVRLRSDAYLLVKDRRLGPDDPIATDLHINATASFYFRLVGDNRQAQIDDMVLITVDVLRAFSGDAVLNFQLEVNRLLRRDGELWLSDDDMFWTPARRKLVTIPYERAPLPYPQF